MNLTEATADWLLVEWLHRELRGQHWRLYALCAQVGPEMWYVGKGGDTAPAKRICARCPVRVECLDYALAHNERFGCWGGLSERERRALRERGAA